MIIFVRHGQTDYNLKNLIQGKIDLELNEEGLRQAEQVSKKLSEINIDKIYSSPLKRAYKTAEIINKNHNVNIVKDDRIEEIGFGSFEGVNKYSITEEVKNERRLHPEKFNAESIESITKRVMNFYDEIKDKNENVIIVSHGGIFKILTKCLNIYEGKFITNCEDVIIKE